MNAVEKYLAYHARNSECWEIDTQTDFGVWYYKRLGLPLETICWYTFLNGLVEFSPLAILLQRFFPNKDSIEDWKIAYLTKGHFLVAAMPYECRWAYYKLGEVLRDARSFIDANGGSLIGAVNRCAVGRTPQERFRNFEKNFRVKCVGKYTNYLWTELLHYCCGVDFEPELDVCDNYSVRSGLIYALGLEGKMSCDKRGSKPTRAEYEILTNGLRVIVNNVKRMNIRPRHKTIWAIETTLCTFNKFNHGKRWLGYYKARQGKQREIVEKLIDGSGIDLGFGRFYDNYMNQWGRWDNNYDFRLDFGGKTNGR